MLKNGKIGQSRVLVLADDLTGALEAGGKFAGQGIASRVAVNESKTFSEAPRDISALVLDTETRHATPDDAANRIHEQAREALARGFSIIYKKTDSTLRGNIGSELCGLLRACPGSGLLYVPAYPKVGRTVRQGILYVDGQPVSRTDFGSDALNPVAESCVLKLLASSIPVPIISVAENNLPPGSGNAVFVCDAVSEEEVERLARFFVESGALNLAAGPAAFLHYLAKEIMIPRNLPPSLPTLQRALIVSGSRNRKSAAQLRHAEEMGFRVARSAEELKQTGDSGWWILENSPQATESSDEAAARVANKVVEILNKVEIDGLVVFGGDTAYAVLRALGQSVIHPIGEVSEGIPVSRIRFQPSSEGIRKVERDLVLVTKAGGFGPISVLPIIRDILI